MKQRRCACPCNEPLGDVSEQVLYKPGHRQRGYRDRVKRRESRAGGLWSALRDIRRVRPEIRSSTT